MNIIIPVGGQLYLSGSPDYPKFLISVERKPLIFWTIESLRRSAADAQISFILPDELEKQFGLERIFNFYCGDHVRAIRIKEETMGAPCSILLAADHFDLDQPTIVCSVDQVLDADISASFREFEERGAAAGVYYFSSVHPKWSYARIGEDQVVKEVREKSPISTNAIAGTYYFRSGELMADAFIKMLRRDDPVQGRFFVAPAMNEVILDQKLVLGHAVDGARYFNFYDEHQIELFERYVSAPRSPDLILSRARQYATAFARRELTAIAGMMAPNFSLKDPNVDIVNDREAAVAFIRTIFAAAKVLQFSVRDIRMASPNETVFEFDLHLDDKHYTGTDFIVWSPDGMMLALRAYVYAKS